MQESFTKPLPEEFHRQIDDLGRIVLPFEYRHVLGIKEQDALCITLDAKRQAIIIAKPTAAP